MYRRISYYLRLNIASPKYFGLNASNPNSFQPNSARCRITSNYHLKASLNPFLDKNGVIHVNGRLSKAPLPFTSRYPILLAAHSIVSLLIIEAHLRILHGGIQLTLSILRKEFWIIRSRNLIKSSINNCVICTRERAALPTQLMGDLPTVRVTPSTHSFLHCGLNYTGPVQIF